MNTAGQGRIVFNRKREEIIGKLVLVYRYRLL